MNEDIYDDPHFVCRAKIAMAYMDAYRVKEKAEQAMRLLAAVCAARSIIQGEEDELVYYIYRRDDRCVKIGRSRNVLARLGQLRREFGSCDLLAVEPGSPAVERARHQRFARSREDGEWFLINEQLISHIVNILEGVCRETGNFGRKTAIGFS